MRSIHVPLTCLLLAGGIMTAHASSPSPPLPDLDALWDFDHPDSTESAFRAILPAAREAEAAGDTAKDARFGAAGSARGYLAELLTQIARTQALQRRFDDAHRTLDEAESLLRADMPRARVRFLLERGRTFNSSGKPDEARPLFLAAWDLARASGEDALAVDAAHMVAIVEKPDQALEWNYKALALAESSPDPKAARWRGSLYNNIGWTLHDSGRYQEALEQFEKALAFRKEQGKQREILIAKWCVARCLRSLGRVEEALAMQEDLEKAWEPLGGSDGYVFEELGECLLALGRPDEARPQFARAYEMLSKDPWLSSGEPERLKRLAELGGVAAH
jgi:tetratricopeptide (TPR) repeat protein